MAELMDEMINERTEPNRMEKSAPRITCHKPKDLAPRALSFCGTAAVLRASVLAFVQRYNATASYTAHCRNAFVQRS